MEWISVNDRLPKVEEVLDDPLTDFNNQPIDPLYISEEVWLFYKEKNLVKLGRIQWFNKDNPIHDADLWQPALKPEPPK